MTETDSNFSYESFLKYQQAGLEASKIPQRLWKTLYEKVIGQVFDAGNDFALVEVDETHKGNFEKFIRHSMTRHL